MMDDPKQHTPWPRYSGGLGSPLKPSDDFVSAVENRIATLCALYGIDRHDPLWERRLLITLLNRHVPGFQLHDPEGRPEADHLWIIENIDYIMDSLEAENGVRPSQDAAIAYIIENVEPGTAFDGMKHSTLMRIYSGRREKFELLEAQLSEQGEALGKILTSQQNLNILDTDSHARLLMSLIRKRRAGAQVL